MIPKASIRAAFEGAGKFTVRAALVVALLSAGYAVTQARGCNDAVTYAKAVYPDATCSAIKTCWLLCRGDADVAVCRAGDRALRCEVGGGGLYDEAKCVEVEVSR